MEAHHATVQFGAIVLTTRSDLTFGLREYGGQQVYVIEDELNAAWYRIGRAEYTFFSLLDGQRTIADALGQAAAVLREDALTEGDAAGLCRWLVECGLATTNTSRQAIRLAEQRLTTESRAAAGKWNLLFRRVPFGSPDRIFVVAAAWIGWLFSGPVLLLWTLLLLGAGTVLALQWDDIASNASSIIEQDAWLWLIGTTVVLKLLHELAHGIACRRFNAPVRDCGLMFILFVPLPFVDVTAAWRIQSKWRRAVVSAAGMFVELAIASVAALVWSFSTDPLVRYHTFNVMVSASLVTVLFNANPLMRFDGYYILSDLLELPNLAAHGQAMLRAWGRRKILGLPSAAPQWPERRSGLVATYGIAAFVWRIFVCVGIILAADAMLFGAGVVIAAFAVVLWVVRPLLHLLWFVAVGRPSEQPSRRRFASWVGGTTVILTGIALLPWSSRVEAPAVVDFDPVVEVRSAVPGLTAEVFVRPGEIVDVGTPLLRLRNDELESKREGLLQAMELSHQQSRILLVDERLAEWDSEQQRLRALQQQLRKTDTDRAKLFLRSPAAGQVLDAHPEHLAGTWIAPGQRVLSIGDPDSLRLHVLIRQQDANAFMARAHSEVDVHLWGHTPTEETAILEIPKPRATRNVPHPAFSSANGGPLAVQTVVPESTQQKAGELSERSNLQLVEPAIHAKVTMPHDGRDIRSGTTGIVGFRYQRGRVGTVVQGEVIRWYVRRQASLRRHWQM